MTYCGTAAAAAAAAADDTVDCTATLCTADVCPDGTGRRQIGSDCCACGATTKTSAAASAGPLLLAPLAGLMVVVADALCR